MTVSFSRVFIRYYPTKKVQIIGIEILRFVKNTDFFIKE